MNAPLRVGLAGLGTVGSAVAGMLLRTKDKLAVRAGRPIDLVAIASKDPPRDQSLDLSSMRQVNDPVALAKDSGIDVFVELMGGSGDPAKAAVEAALGIGRPVVSANKALIAKHGTALIQLAEQHNAAFNFEAAVGGGIPVIKTLREGLGGAEISRVYGILNGTCNYILTTMQKGAPSRIAFRKRRSSATPRPTRPSTSAASTPRTRSRS
jgi:homoserine dehydrogenase